MLEEYKKFYNFLCIIILNSLKQSLKIILNLHVIQKFIYGVAAVSPPSTIISVPVIYLASSEHKNKTA